MSRALVNRALRPQWLLIAGMALLLAGCDEGKEPAAGGQEQMPPSAVTLETLQRSSMERVEEYPARIRGVREVQVRARVPGILLERTYAEGSEVAQGDVLFRIDPDQYSVQVQQAQAAVATARFDDHANVG